MNYLDLFSGIGGFYEGLKQASFKFDWVGYSEIDKYAKQIYKKHFLEAEDLGDVRTIDTSRLPRIHLITFGFPCQDISVAGKRAGLRGERSGLFSEAIRIIRDTKPDYFIFENVKGLFSSNQGRDFEYILRTIADIGYDGQWQLLNTRWVLPQNRERIYFVGYPRNLCGQKIFPVGEGAERTNERTEQTTVNTLSAGGHSGGHHSSMCLIQINSGVADAQRIYDSNGIARTLKGVSGGQGGKTGLYSVAQALQTDGMLYQGSSFGTNISQSQRAIRRLTPSECEKLQGFEVGWTEGISDSQRYKCLGNAVTVPIVKMVGEKLLEVIRNANKKHI